MTDSFTVLLRVRYAECDAQQVVFNSRYAEYADLAATEYMRALVGGYQALINQGYDNQLVNMNLSWQSPARFDDILAMQVWVSKVGKSSFTMNIKIQEHESNRAICDIEIVYVMVDATDFQKRQVPNDFRQKLLAGPTTAVVDLAAVGN
ncbi:thioesterase family protein [Aliiglaciecola litoralis]|uniref:Thioesterase family protein n=1 Tax=Aliiglaciecola litoralis TaxID=582857 RepID=A0ABN1LC53_9ALTE